MKVLIQNYLEPYVNSLNQKREYFVPKKDQTINLYQMGSLLGSGVILPARMHYLDKITIKDVVEMECNEPAIKLIDLSGNQLSDDDLVFVDKLVQKLNTQGKLERAVLNLGSNHICGKVEPLKSFVRRTVNSFVNLEQIRFVILASNPFSTVDNKNFFQSIGIEQQDTSSETVLAEKMILKKLVWLDHKHGKSGNGEGNQNFSFAILSAR